MIQTNQRDLQLFVFFQAKRFVSTNHSHACSVTPGSWSSYSNDVDSFIGQKTNVCTLKSRGKSRGQKMQWKLERQRDPKTKTGHRDFFRSSPPNSYEQRAIVMRRNCIETKTELQADRLMDLWFRSCVHNSCCWRQLWSSFGPSLGNQCWISQEISRKRISNGAAFPLST